MDSLMKAIKSGLKTVLCFVIAGIIFPFFICSYGILSISRKFWLSLLSNRYKYLEFAKTNNVRSLVDTSRNPGVLHILIKVQGECNVDVIKKNFQDHVLGRKDKLGRTAFSRLKWNLISCWGHYAWIKNTDRFDIKNHIIYFNSYRGRTVTEAIVSDHVSDIISKNMPPDIPPWQIYVIPISSSIPSMTQASTSTAEYYSVDNYYLMVRIHHLILEEENNLNISDILMLNERKTQIIINRTNKIQSPFLNLIEKPQKVPKLVNCIKSGICNRWNEFIYTYDPLESPDGEKMKIVGIMQLLSVLVIITVTVLSDFHKGFNAVKSHPSFKLQYLNNLIKRELKRRNLSWDTMYKAIKYSIDPVNIFKFNLFLIWQLTIKVCIMWPYYLYREIEACRTCLFTNDCLYPNTICGFLYEYVPLIFGSAVELIIIATIIIRAPKLIYEELFDKKNEDHCLQNISLCGRKVISWSDSIEQDTLQNVASSNGVSEIDVLLSMTSASLREFFNQLGKDNEEPPTSIHISGRSLNDQYLLGKQKYEAAAGGFVCIKLPIDCTSRKQLRDIKASVAEARDRQIVSYLLTLAQLKYDIITNALPAVWMKVLLNYLSRRFTVTLTEISETNPSCRYVTMWGDEIIDLIYFRPPQANIGLSLTIQKYNSRIRLGVMTDALIAPNHNDISLCWSEQINRFNYLFNSTTV